MNLFHCDWYSVLLTFGLHLILFNSSHCNFAICWSQGARPSPQDYRPHRPSASHQWGAHGHPSAQLMGYSNCQQGVHSSQSTRFIPLTYGGYPPQQTAPRSDFNAGWDHRLGLIQTTPSQSGYDHNTHGAGYSQLPTQSVTAPIYDTPSG